MEQIDKDIFTLLSISYLSYVDVMALRYCNKYLSLLSMPSFDKIFRDKLYEILELDPNKLLLDVYPSLCEYEQEKEIVSQTINEMKGQSKIAMTDMSLIRFVNEELYNRMCKLRYGIIRELFKCDATLSGPFMLDCLL